MPITRRRRTTRRPTAARRLKRGYRKTRGYRRTMRMDRTLTGRIQPAIAYVNMKYSTSITLNPGLGGVDTYHFRCHSIHDPDFTGIGHQPTNHDMYATLYAHYEVLSSRIVVRPVPVAGTLAHTMQYALTIVNDSGTSVLSYESIREFSRGPMMLYGQNETGKRGISMGWNRRKGFGPNQFQQLGSDFGSNPATTQFYRIQAAAFDSVTDPSATTVLVDVYYKVRLTRPIQQEQS